MIGKEAGKKNIEYNLGSKIEMIGSIGFELLGWLPCDKVGFVYVFVCIIQQLSAVIISRYQLIRSKRGPSLHYLHTIAA